MPLGLRVPLALALVSAAAFAVLAPAPSARARVLWFRPALASLVAAGVWTGVAAQAGRDGAARALLCAAALMLALTVWLHRGEDPPPDPDPPEDQTSPPPGPTIDWDRWEREFDPHPVA